MFDFKLWLIRRKQKRIKQYNIFILKVKGWLKQEKKELKRLIKEYDNSN